MELPDDIDGELVAKRIHLEGVALAVRHRVKKDAVRFAERYVPGIDIENMKPEQFLHLSMVAQTQADLVTLFAQEHQLKEYVAIGEIPFAELGKSEAEIDATGIFNEQTVQAICADVRIGMLRMAAQLYYAQDLKSTKQERKPKMRQKDVIDMLTIRLKKLVRA